MGRTRAVAPWLAAGLIATVAAAPSAAHGATARGTAVRVLDGDTVQVKVGRATRTYHLTGLDAPELRGSADVTCFGREARNRLRRLLPRRARVTVRTSGRSRRAEILRGRKSVNRTMVRGGYAEALEGGGTLGRRLRRDEEAAQDARRGLWETCKDPLDPGVGGAPPGSAPGPPSAGPGDVTGQEAIDQMTAVLRDGRFQKFRNRDGISDAFQLDLCGDGRFRMRQGTTFESSFMATEALGQPWTVVEALIRGDGSYRGARVQGTVRERRSTESPPRAVEEQAEVILEEQNGSVFWDGERAEHLAGAAACDPTV